MNEFGIENLPPFQNPPSPDLGELSIVVNKLTKDQDIEAFAKSLSFELVTIEELSSVDILKTGDKKKKQGIVFLNFKIKSSVKKQLRSDFVSGALVKILSKNYGHFTDHNGNVAIVEHTSANPISPIHVGNLRNSVHGDTFARILERTGYKVFRHFYVNDLGLQVAFTVVGYEILRSKHIRPDIKIDHWVGKIYAIMNNFYYSQTTKVKYNLSANDLYFLSSKDVIIVEKRLSSDIKKLREDQRVAEQDQSVPKSKKKTLRDISIKIQKILDQIDEVSKLNSTGIDLRTRFPQIYSSLIIEVKSFDLTEKTRMYLKNFSQDTDERIVELFYEVVNWVLEGFMTTLRKFNIEFDQFDYESKVTHSGLPDELILKLRQSPNIKKVEGKAIRYSYPPEAMKEFRQNLGFTKNDLPIKGHIPELQLTRTDGTALYAAKDIGYSITKFESRNADVVYNVISVEQTLPQFQLLLPLYELGYKNIAKNMKHYSYENVELRGRIMSGRLALYVTADEYFDETFIRSRMAKRKSEVERNIAPPSDHDGWREDNDILLKVTQATTRFPLIETSPKKRIVLDLDRELDFRRNSGPFVQYAHARACGIIEKILSEKGFIPNVAVNPVDLIDDDSIFILTHLLNLKVRIDKAVNQLDPSIIASWCFELATKFMSYYEKYPVLNAENELQLKARLGLIEAVRIGLANGLSILGINPTNKL